MPATWLSASTGFSQAYFNWGCGSNLSRYEEAIDDFKQAIRFKPDYGKAPLLPGGILAFFRRSGIRA
jgi:tetratricopeptide (TPR) repeat protein